MAQKFNGDVEVGGTLRAAKVESERLGNKLKEAIRRFISEYGEEKINDLFADTMQNITESLAESERAFSLQRQTLEQQLDEQTQNYNATRQALEVMTEKYNEAVTHFNAAIQTINGLNERLTALEANYDPTIIE